MSDAYFIRKRRKDNFTILNNTCIKDSAISWKAKGVHTYLMSLPSDWKIFIREIVKHAADGKAALYSAIKELERYGYIRKLQSRNEKGYYSSTVYYVFEEPNSDKLEPDSDFPHTDNRNADNRDADYRPLLNTNLHKTNKQKTVLTNSECVQTVSESVFFNAVKRLFNDEYPFDAEFEGAVISFLEKSAIDNTQIELYLNYVFERTKMGKVQKSFEGLFYKLALSSSIVRDFKLSNQSAAEPQDNSEHNTEPCPICGQPANIYIQCANCEFDMVNRNNKAKVFRAQQVYNLGPDTRLKYDSDIKQVMTKIQEAGGLLGNPKLKERYDHELAAIDEKFRIKKWEG